MRMLFAVAIKGLEDCGREVPNMDWLAAVSLRSVELGKGFDADDLGSRARHALRLTLRFLIFSSRAVFDFDQP